MANTTFRPKAKLVSMLGESLISDNSVGLYELVKNSYDADASSVLVELTDTKTQKKTALVIRDDGTGMTTNDLLEKWMTPANPHKAETKHGAGKTEKGRTPLGRRVLAALRFTSWEATDAHNEMRVNRISSVGELGPVR